MKKNNIYGAAAIISLFVTIALRYLWIIENNGESAALAILMFASCAVFSFAAAGYVTGGWTTRYR